jgi:hypothetical protein
MAKMVEEMLGVIHSVVSQLILRQYDVSVGPGHIIIC